MPHLLSRLCVLSKQLVVLKASPLIQTVFRYSDELVASASTVVYGAKVEVLIAFGNSGVFSEIYNTYACLGFFVFLTLVKLL